MSGDQLDVAGTLDSLDIAGLVSGSAGFHVSKKTVSIGVSAALLDVTLSNLHLKVGTDTVGLEITAGSIAFGCSRRPLPMAARGSRSAPPA